MSDAQISVEIAITPTRRNAFQRILLWISQWKTFSLGIFISFVFITTTLLAPVIAPYPPEKTDYDHRFRRPNLGTLDGHG